MPRELTLTEIALLVEEMRREADFHATYAPLNPSHKCMESTLRDYAERLALLIA